MEKVSTLKDFRDFTVKIIIAQTLTYFVFGLLASKLLNYESLFGQEIINNFMRPFDSGYVMAGPFLQPIRGFLFALILWPIRDIFLSRKNGWLILWGLFVVFGILSTPAAAPCSIEGFIYSRLPLSFHLLGLPEIMFQTLAFSVMTVWWLKRPHKKELPENIGKARAVFLRGMFAVMIACFGYIGYAIGGILIARMSGVEIHLKGEAFDISRQMIFVFAFCVNVIGILIFTSKGLFGKLPVGWLFAIFWAVDTLAPLAYQAVFFHAMPIHLALIMGFFPALIIVFSYRINSKNYALVNGVRLAE